ncbi:uncharacterized protein LOC128880202 [Hylaeus volcanicus]|uniref:uncharacterized protein LOC128880202 n=1 Tax=Hylaeus volcanicus TaxID=313075 RepID=UPI0023B7E90C|nr:uncharacterized protein LOC128880202 [Hylaeus volcanicus]XP_053985988.1 uncharacterized protein LOC128880202 [Hylaeus volcanicus]
MDKFSNTSQIEESLDIATKDWNRITSAAKKAGYREGIENGADSVFQEGFDKGYEEAFKTAFILGKFKSLLNTQDTEYPSSINKILDKTRRGACYICEMESQNKNDDTQKPFPQIINEQRTHSMKVIETLCQYFQPHMKELNITESDILGILNQISQPSNDN